ncbi:hypothetical protein [Methanobrevibacter sp.]|uniref:hypothetical protein n=1 Tax=Methanobrevibacter sp. TaxID=66852 RepID=UPI00386C70C0
MINFMKKSFQVLALLLLILLSVGSIQAMDVDNANITADAGNSTVKTYSDLQILVNDTEEGSTLVLNESFEYNSTSDESLIDGVSISRNITIIGKNNAYFDGGEVSRCLFIGSNCSVILKNITFKNGYSENGGGAVFLNETSNLTLYDCIFDNNRVYNSDGGALNARVGTNVEIYNCTFANNTSTRVSNLAWDSYKCGMGSAICVRIGSNLRISDSKFLRNNAFLATILLVTYNDVTVNLSTIMVNNTLFENNTSTNRGVIYLDELGRGEFLNSVFRNNHITHSGGVLEIDTAEYSLVENCRFEDNSAVTGGAINIKVFDTNYLSNAIVRNCVFMRNKASSYGGAIASKYGVTEISNCKFYFNDAATYGGAIYSKYGSIKISDSSFGDNSANDGGAIYINSDHSSVVNSGFARNIANEKGGAICSKNTDIYSVGCKYSKNTAPAGVNVYGAFLVKITYSTKDAKNLKIKIKITSPWKVSLAQKIKIKISSKNKYTSKWLKTNSKGQLTITVPSKVTIAKKYIKISMKNGVGSVQSITKIKDSAKFKYDKKVKKGSKIAVTAKNKATKKLIKKTKFKVKVFTGKKYKTFVVKSNSKGIFKIKTKNLTKGLHKINVILNNSKYNVNSKFYVRIK